MQIINLSHLITSNITVFNESEKPEIRFSHTHDSNHYSQHHISIYSHNSTHIDAPYHILPHGKSLDEYPMEKFFGPAIIADCSNYGSTIHKEELLKFNSDLQNAHFLLINTGWHNKWNTDSYMIDFPILSKEAAQWLTEFNLKGIGFDTISVDPVDSIDLPVHKILLGDDLIIIENLANLHSLPFKGFYFSCFPLYYQQSDGSPVRAAAIISE